MIFAIPKGISFRKYLKPSKIFPKDGFFLLKESNKNPIAPILKHGMITKITGIEIYKKLYPVIWNFSGISIKRVGSIDTKINAIMFFKKLPLSPIFAIALKYL